MANRVPLVVDTSTLYIKELPVGDNLDLSGSGIVGLSGVGGTSANFSGIVTASAYYVDATQVISNGRQLQNIASLDSTTTATIENAIANAPNDFTSLNVTGVSTTRLLNVGVGGTIITTTNTPRVGINSTAPGYTLDVGGDLNFSGALYQGGVLFTSGVGIQSGGVIIGTGVTTLNFVGAGNTFVVSGTTATISIAGGGVKENTTVSSTSPTTIATFATASFRSAKARIQITQGSSYQVAEVLLIHDGTTVTLVEMASVATGSNLGSFSGTISGGDVLLRVTMVSATSATIRVVIDRTEV